MKTLSALGLFAGSLFLLTTTLPSSDVGMTVQEAANGVYAGEFYFEKAIQAGGGRAPLGKSGEKTYVWYEIGNKLTLAIPIAVARGVKTLAGLGPDRADRYDDAIDGFAVALFFVFLVQASFVLTFRLALRLGVSLRAALLATLAGVLTGGFWYYAKPIVRDTLLLLPAVAAFSAAVEWTRAPVPGRRALFALLAGVMLGWGISLKISFAAIALGVVTLMALHAVRERAAGGAARLAAAVGIVASCCLAAFAAVFLWNLRTFGHWMPPFYSGVLGHEAAPFRYAYSLSFSPGNGIFLYHPFLILALAGVLPLWRRRPDVAAGVLTAIVASFLLFTSFPRGDGWISFGGRFMLPAVLLGLIPLAAAVEAYGKAGRWILALLTAVGLFVWLPSLELPKNIWAGPGAKAFGKGQVLMSFRTSPPVMHWRILAGEVRDLLGHEGAAATVTAATRDGGIATIPVPRWESDLLLADIWGRSPRAAVAFVFGLAASAAFSGVALLRTVRGKRTPCRTASA